MIRRNYPRQLHIFWDKMGWNERKKKKFPISVESNDGRNDLLEFHAIITFPSQFFQLEFQLTLLELSSFVCFRQQTDVALESLVSSSGLRRRIHVACRGGARCSLSKMLCSLLLLALWTTAMHMGSSPRTMSVRIWRLTSLSPQPSSSSSHIHRWCRWWSF